MRVRFAMVCDSCGRRGPEYDESFTEMDDAGDDVCAACRAGKAEGDR
jgi:hypothetical protein